MSEKTHETRDWFHYLVILPAVGLVSVERFIREELAERWAIKERRGR